MSTYADPIYEKNLTTSICSFDTIRIDEYNNTPNDSTYIYSGLTLTLNCINFTSQFNTTGHTYSNYILNNDVYSYTGITGETHYFTIYNFYSGATPYIDPLLVGMNESNVISGFSQVIISCVEYLQYSGNCCPIQVVKNNLPWVVLTNTGGGTDNCEDYIARRTEKGWTLDFIFNKNNQSWINSPFFYTGVRDEHEPLNYGDNNVSFGFTDDGRIYWKAYRFSGYCDTVSGYSENFYYDYGQTPVLCTNGTSGDFNITISFERYYEYVDCEIPNEGGWNDLIFTGDTTEELSKKWTDVRNKRLGVLKVYHNGKPIYKLPVRNTLNTPTSNKINHATDWEEVVLSNRGFQPFTHVIGGGVSGSGGVHEGICCYTIKRVMYFEEPMHFTVIYDRYINEVKPLYEIIECSDTCDDTITAL